MTDDWQQVLLSEVTEAVKNWNPSNEPYIHYVDISSIDNHRCEIAETRRLAGADAPSRARRPLKEGDVLFSNVRTYLRNIALVPKLPSPAVASTGFTLLRPKEGLDSRFLYHLVRSDHFIAEVTPKQTGTLYPATSDRVVRGQAITVPNLSTQRSIAALIDQAEVARHSAMDHVSSGLRSIKMFEESVLADACTGRLTVEWRKGEGLETQEVEQRIETAQIDASLAFQLPELPEGFEITTIGSVATAIEYGSNKKLSPDAGGVPVLRMGNIQDGRVVLDDLKYCPDPDDVSDLMLRNGDLLFNRTNSPALVGKSAVFDRAEPMSFASYLVRVQFDLSLVEPEFVNYWLNSAWGRSWARAVKTDGVSQSNINATKLGSMPIPLPSIEEQREIIRRTRQLLATARDISCRLESASQKIDEMAQALLFKLFRHSEELGGA